MTTLDLNEIEERLDRFDADKWSWSFRDDARADAAALLAEIRTLRAQLESVTAERDHHAVQRALAEEIVARYQGDRATMVKDTVEAAEARATAAEQRVAELQRERDHLRHRAGVFRSVLEGFQKIGFQACKNPRCYRPTLSMMQRADAALCNADVMDRLQTTLRATLATTADGDQR